MQSGSGCDADVRVSGVLTIKNQYVWIAANTYETGFVDFPVGWDLVKLLII